MQGGYRQPCIEIPENTKKGYAEAYEGDGVYINRPHQKRGCVQKNMIQTIKTSVDDIGVVVRVGNYSPSGHNASSIVSGDGIAPTVMENHGTVTAVVEEPICLNSKGGRNGIEGLQPSLQDRIYSSDSISVAITTSFHPSYTNKTGLGIRKLTPRECWRLMGVKDSDFDKVSPNQSASSLYHLSGDSIVCQVLMHIFFHLL
jgi:site-specific DNA-cytosine methylase